MEGVQIDIATVGKVHLDEATGMYSLLSIGSLLNARHAGLKPGDHAKLSFFVQATFEPALCGREHVLRFHIEAPDGERVAETIEMPSTPIEYEADGHGYTAWTGEIVVRLSVSGVYLAPMEIDGHYVHTIRVPIAGL